MAGSHEVRGSNPLCSTIVSAVRLGGFFIAFANAPAFGAKGADMDEQDEYRRPENEDDDGYDPYSDRPAYEPQYEEDPWA